MNDKKKLEVLTDVSKLGNDTFLYEYENYEQYKEVQTKLNVKKLTWGMWDLAENLKELSSYLQYKLGNIKKGLCHGTRRGEEQQTFRKLLKADVWGTEISHTATQFPFTYEWDFHEQKDEWIGQMDFVYSNSLDQAYDPQRALSIWLEQIHDDGFVILARGRGHESEHASIGDPFGGTVDSYKKLAKLAGGEVDQILDFGRASIKHLLVKK